MSNYFGHHPPLSFGLRWLFAACLHSVLRLSTAFSLRRLFRGLPPLGPGITFRLSRITFTLSLKPFESQQICPLVGPWLGR